MPIAGVTRELLVRYLEVWAPEALRAGSRATFAQAWSGAGDAETVAAALRVFGEFADRLRNRTLTVVLVGPDAADLARGAEADRVGLGLPERLTVHGVAGDPAPVLPVGLHAAGAAGAPLLTYVDSDVPPPLAAVAGAGRPTELLLCTAAGTWPTLRDDLRAAGFGLTAGVELVNDRTARLLAFATSAAKRLEAFKDSLWALDEYAGVRYRDPADPEANLLDISLTPWPGPLRRELLAHLATGERTVTDLRRYTLTETVYRAQDAVRALTTLLSRGAVSRSPERGRLSGDVVISLATDRDGARADAADATDDQDDAG